MADTQVLPGPGKYAVTHDGISGNNKSVVPGGSGAIFTAFVDAADALIFADEARGITNILNPGKSPGAANLAVGSPMVPASAADSVFRLSRRATGPTGAPR